MPFRTLEIVPPDPIFHLKEPFAADVPTAPVRNDPG
jgi:hypothetical protein